MTGPQSHFPITVTYDSPQFGITLWLRTRPDAPAGAVHLDSDEAVCMRGALAAAIDGGTAGRTVTGNGRWPRLRVASEAHLGKIGLWVQPEPDGPAAPFLLTADDVRTLVAALTAAIDERDSLVTALGRLDEIPETETDH